MVQEAAGHRGKGWQIIWVIKGFGAKERLKKGF
jgi:hypothetical protein